MRSENFVAFFIVCGFFIGTIFSMVKFEDPIYFLLSTVMITFFFYLFIHVVLIFYVSSMETSETLFDTKEFEETSNEQIADIKSRENLITALLKSIHNKETVEEEGVRGYE